MSPPAANNGRQRSRSAGRPVFVVQATRPNQSIDSPAAAIANSAPAPAKMNAISVSFFSLISRVDSEL
jgi:hypothetical protein